MRPTKEEVIPELMEWHFQVDPEMVKAYRFLSPNEDDPKEPIKFLEVSPDTPEEVEQVQRGEIPLPAGWDWDEKQDLTELAMPAARPNGHKP